MKYIVTLRRSIIKLEDICFSSLGSKMMKSAVVFPIKGSKSTDESNGMLKIEVLNSDRIFSESALISFSSFFSSSLLSSGPSS